MCVEDVQRESRSRSKNSESGYTWQVVQQKSAVKQFLGFRKTSEMANRVGSSSGSRGRLHRGMNQKSLNMIGSNANAANSRQDEQMNGLR